MAARGGKPRQVLTLDESKLERADLWPQFLPDGKHFVFYQQTDPTETSGVYVGSMDPPECHRLFVSQTNAVYSAATPDTPKTGYLLYINERNLMAQQFNAGRLETARDPIALATEIGAARSLSLAPISVSTTGVLVYQGVGQPMRQMEWMDRGGRQVAVAGEPGIWVRREFRRTGSVRLWRRLERTARPPTCGCSMSADSRSRLPMGRCTKGRPYGRRTGRALPTSASRATPTTSLRARRKWAPQRHQAALAGVLQGQRTATLAL